uniref:RAB3GAP2_N domain-containing protein n=1 Tax=Macrostomum lignano TaxID=282301 RepID=A0A1I8FFI1_9PLAT
TGDRVLTQFWHSTPVQGFKYNSYKAASHSNERDSDQPVRPAGHGQLGWRALRHHPADSPVYSVFVTAGQSPFVGFFYASEDQWQPLLSNATELAFAVATKVKSALLSAAASWLTGGGSQSGRARCHRRLSRSPQSGAGDAAVPALRPDGQAPPGRGRGLVDAFGRVTLVGLEDGTALRMWKGYRARSGGRALFLVIYASRRGGLLEVWTGLPRRPGCRVQYSRHGPAASSFRQTLLVDRRRVHRGGVAAAWRQQLSLVPIGGLLLRQAVDRLIGAKQMISAKARRVDACLRTGARHADRHRWKCSRGAVLPGQFGWTQMRLEATLSDSAATSRQGLPVYRFHRLSCKFLASDSDLLSLFQPEPVAYEAGHSSGPSSSKKQQQEAAQQTAVRCQGGTFPEPRPSLEDKARLGEFLAQSYLARLDAGFLAGISGPANLLHMTGCRAFLCSDWAGHGSASCLADCAPGLAVYGRSWRPLRPSRSGLLRPCRFGRQPPAPLLLHACSAHRLWRRFINDEAIWEKLTSWLLES